MNAFRGKLEEEGFQFCVIDHFEDFEGGKAFFLSHFHRDHMRGISSPSFNQIFKDQSDVYFYCSEITKTFMERDPEIQIPSEKIYMLENEDPVYIAKGDICVKVTPLRAGHCPGSIMLLFESYGGRVLYTGDFRLSTKDLEKSQTLFENGQLIKLNNIYLDTTFADACYATFPSRETSFKIIKEIIIRSKKLYNVSYIAILPPASVGIEYLMIELYKEFKKLIHVSDYSYHRFHSFIQPLENLITTDISLTDIHFCSFNRRDCSPCPLKDVKYKVLKIKPSALYFDVDVAEQNEFYVQVDVLYFRVAYSSHCSLDELNDFVTFLKPMKITPLVIADDGTKELVIEMVCNWKNPEE
ncbi:DNA cross-link repair protein snm1 [Rhodnius prolixus]|uniref:DNA cross-link repair protein snm1 n=1 Tax=Rhodnius prolixus TaxID=13249 RepID=UPI003D18DA7A